MSASSAQVLHHLVTLLRVATDMSASLGVPGSRESQRRRPRPNKEPEGEPEILDFSDSERDDCALTPQLKKLRLTEETTLCPSLWKSDVKAARARSPARWNLQGPCADAMSLDVEKPYEPEPAPSTPADLSMTGSDSSQEPDEFSKEQLWRAEVQRLAQDQMRRYREELRSCEMGPLTKPRWLT